MSIEYHMRLLLCEVALWFLLKMSSTAWQDRLISVATEKAQNMTRRSKVAVPRLDGMRLSCLSIRCYRYQ